MAEPFSSLLFGVIWQRLAGEVTAQVFKEGWKRFINESRNNEQVNIDLTVALEKCFYFSQKTIAQRCLQELINKSTWTQYRGVKTYNPPENDRDIKKLEKKIDLLKKQLRKAGNQKPDNQSVINTNQVQELLTQLSQSNSQSNQETKDDIEKLFAEAEKDCDVDIYKKHLRNEEDGLIQNIINSFFREIEANERLNRIFIAIKTTSIEEGVRRTEASVQELHEKIDTLSPSTVTPKPIFFGVPSLTYFVNRPQHYSALKKLLLSEENKSSGTLVIAAIHGLGGIGKTTLASALVHDEEVQANFPDGVLWITLGQQPNLLDLLNRWIRALGDRDYNPTTAKDASAHLKTLLFDKKVLLVVDDVWKLRDLEFFQVGRNGSKVLVTTREVQIVGASRYDLDVMTADESLELIQQLIENSTGNSLNTSEKEKAHLFARKVGYLPLALELGAAQVADGVTWDKLLNNLQAEIVRLNKLDKEDDDLEDISEEDKRKYSLVASFNLSLRRLKKEELKRFTWLGILPEDETIKEAMVTTLWEVDQEDAEKTLRLLRRKALLKPSYQLHDLMQDMAKELLTASPNPSQEEILPGLGLTLQEAHSALLDRYLSKTQNGLWHTLPPDGYIHTNLSWHLEQAKRTDELHQLLKEETAAGRNGWFEVCESIGQIASFVSHVTNAWRLAEEMFEQNPSEAISLQCRYALIISTLNTLANNIPAELIAALVEKKLWIPEQGLAYAQQAQDSGKRADILSALAPHLPESLLDVALEAVRGIQDDSYRAQALVSLAPYLSPEILQEALEAVRAIQYESRRAQALVSLAPYLSSEQLEEALEAARAIQNKLERAEVLGYLAPHLSPEIFHEALEAARAIQYEYDRADALGSLAPHLSPEQLQQALEAVLATMQSVFSSADALGNLAPHLSPEQLQQALEAARGIQDEYYRARALDSLAPHLSPEHLQQALEAARAIQDDYHRVDVLGKLASYLSPEIFKEALEAARGIQSNSVRAAALSKLAPHFSLEQLQQALEAVLGIQDKLKLPFILSWLVPYLFPEQLQQALEVVRGIQDDSYCASALGKLAPHLSPEIFHEALEAARGIQDEYERADVLGELAPHLSPEIFHEALEAARGIQSNSDRADALGKLAPHLSPEIFQEALAALHYVYYESNRADILGKSAPHLSPKKLQQALEAARGIRNEYYRAKTLGKLAPHLSPEIFQEALEAARGIQGEYERADALGELAPHLSPEILQEALEASLGIKDKYKRAKTLGKLAPHLSPEQLQQVLEAARGIQDESNRAYTFSSLFPELDLTNIEYKFWCEILHNLSHHTRPKLLEDIPKLTDAIIALGSKEALRGTVTAIQDVCRQWK